MSSGVHLCAIFFLFLGKGRRPSGQYLLSNSVLNGEMVRGVRTAGGGGGGFEGFWASLPPVTKCLGATWLFCAISSELGLLPYGRMALVWPLVVKKLQIWRLVTNFLVLGGFSPDFVFRMLWLAMYSPSLEKLMTEYNPGEYAFLLMFTMVLFNIVSLFLNLAFCARPLVFTIVYLWARNNSTQMVSIWGLFQVQAFYLPWALLVMGMMFGQKGAPVIADIAGIGIGHLYYFFMTLYPLSSGQQVLKCPIWLSRAMGKFYGKEGNNAAPGSRSQGATQGATQGFRAFRGSGRRLSD